MVAKNSYIVELWHACMCICFVLVFYIRGSGCLVLQISCCVATPMFLIAIFTTFPKENFLCSEAMYILRAIVMLCLRIPRFVNYQSKSSVLYSL